MIKGLDKPFLNQQKQILERRRDSLASHELPSTGQHEVCDDAEAALLEEQAGVDLSLHANESGQLYGIRAALQRIKDGVYGVCNACDNPITKARLTALPEASHCIECQRQAERTLIQKTISHVQDLSIDAA